MIERTALLARLKPVVTELEDDTRVRVAQVDELAEHLAREHEKAVAADRTAMSLQEWQEGEITQAAVAWVLACVFVRFLEDNQLVDQAQLSGPGDRRAAALGRREEYFRRHPSTVTASTSKPSFARSPATRPSPRSMTSATIRSGASVPRRTARECCARCGPRSIPRRALSCTTSPTTG
jgi:hypothetical protein